MIPSVPLGILMLALCLGLWQIGKGGKRLRLALGMMGALLPAALIFLYVDAGKDPFGQVTIRLAGLALNDEADAPPLSIGGDAVCDDIVISRIKPQAFAIRQGAISLLDGGTDAARCPTAAAASAAAADSTREDERQNAADATVGLYSVEAPPPLLPISRPEERLARSVALEPGQRFCLFGCTENGGRWYKVGASGRDIVLENDAQADLPELPRKPFASFLALPSFSEYQAAQAIFPLRDYGIEQAESFAPFDNPCRAGRQLCDPATQAPVNSFLFFDGNSQLSIAVLDRDARVGNGPSQAAGGEPESIELVNGNTLHFWEVRYSDTLTDFSERPRASYLRKRMSARYRTTDDGGRLDFLEGAPAQRISSQQLAEAKARDARGGTGTTVFIGGAQRSALDSAVGNVIRFERIGGTLASSLLSAGASPVALTFTDVFADQKAAILPAVQGVENVRTPRLGQTSFVQEQAGFSPASLRFSMDRLSFPSSHLLTSPSLVAWAVVAWTLAMLFLVWSRLHLHPGLLITLTVVQFLLAFRILVAFGSFGLDPSEDPLGRTAEVIVAYVAVPAILLALHPRPQWRLVELVIPAIIAAAVGWAAWSTGGLSWKVTALAVASVVMLIGAKYAQAAALRLATRVERRWSRWQAWLAKFGKKDKGKDTDDADASKPGPKPGSVLGPFLVAAFLLFLVRLVMIPIGKEQIFGMRISVVYLPLAILIWAGLIQAVRTAGKDKACHPLGAMLGIGATLAAPAFASDSGFMLIAATPPVVYLLFVTIQQFKDDYPIPLIIGGGLALTVVAALIMPTPLLRGIAAATVLLATGLVFLMQRRANGKSTVGLKIALALGFATAAMVGLVSLTPGSMVRALSGETVYRVSADDDVVYDTRDKLIGALQEYDDRGVNSWRLSAIFDPVALNEAGLDDAERLRRWRFTLENLTASPWGNGFPYDANIAEVRVNQADDNLTAVHLMAPFGRMGGAAMILLLAMTAITVGRLGNARDGIARSAGKLAIWSFAFAGIYMILANLMLVPFTGRNLYFLAAFSFSDLLEGLVLVAMAGWLLNSPLQQGAKL